MEQKEANFMKSVKNYISLYGYKHFYDPVPPKKGKLLPETIQLEKVKADISEYESEVKKSIEKHEKLYKRFKDYPNIEMLIYRYDTMGFLNNISLSVHPSLKKKWGITHEMFGAFYNSDYPYCSLFPDLEDSLGNVMNFKPKKDMVILVNPPYTQPFIKWTIEKLLEWKDKSKFIVILPVWDKKTRSELKLKGYPDLPEIRQLIDNSDSSTVENIPFYDGLNNKKVFLKDPVHIIVL